MDEQLRTSSGLFTTVIRTLVYTDLVGSTSIVSRIGDEASARLFRRHDKAVRQLIARFEGVELERTDGFLAMFRRPIDAVCYALALHPELEKLSQEAGVTLRARAGIHMGEVVLVEVKGGSKEIEAEGMSRILCSRIMSLAQGGQTLLSRGAWDLARRAAVNCENLPANVKWLSHGEYLLKGVEAEGEPEPVGVYEVGEEGRAPLSPPTGSEKAQPVAVTQGIAAAARRPAPRYVGWALATILGIALGAVAVVKFGPQQAAAPAAQPTPAGPRRATSAGEFDGAPEAARQALAAGDLAAARQALRAEPSPRNMVLMPVLEFMAEAEAAVTDPKAPLEEKQRAMRAVLHRIGEDGLPPDIKPETAWGAALYLLATQDDQADATIEGVRVRLPEFGRQDIQRRAQEHLMELQAGEARAAFPRPPVARPPLP